MENGAVAIKLKQLTRYISYSKAAMLYVTISQHATNDLQQTNRL